MAAPHHFVMAPAAQQRARPWPFSLTVVSLRFINRLLIKGIIMKAVEKAVHRLREHE